jgi:hypothetical protein
MRAEDTVPTRKNFSAASTASPSRFWNPVRAYSGMDISSKATKRRMKSRAEASASIPSSDDSMIR